MRCPPTAVLCIVEVMKLMNSVTAGAAGEVAAVFVKDGDLVEFEQPLFAIRAAVMKHRIFVANRGEIAVRIIEACDRLGYDTVLGVSTADKDTLAAKRAGRVVTIGGPRPARQLPEHERRGPGRPLHRVHRGPPWLRLPLRTAGIRRTVRRERPDLRGPVARGAATHWVTS